MKRINGDLMLRIIFVVVDLRDKDLFCVEQVMMIELTRKNIDIGINTLCGITRGRSRSESIWFVLNGVIFSQFKTSVTVINCSRKFW